MKIKNFYLKQLSKLNTNILFLFVCPNYKEKINDIRHLDGQKKQIKKLLNKL